MHLKQWWLLHALLCIATLLYLLPFRVPLCTGVTVQVIIQVMKSRKFLPCPCAAPCSELPASGRAEWAAVACTPPEEGNEEVRRWSESTKRPLCDGETDWGLFWGGEEKKEEERLSHSHEQKQTRERLTSKREGGTSIIKNLKKQKFFHSCTDRLFELNGVLWTSEGL